ncbi:hypothetical protein GUJ93_ZPchr0011g28570 [Zizania palustris]|uniref:Glycoside hydrolase family 31 TIM barrel domain-containing protein n=1 Tax=Zizania palustris TaxID=103762 RepID=A0A8J5WLD4_ZIZPA|nr:hypothetical protein GUJ93_ZPchr0011g28570 [Zizania palustris]
MALPLVGFAKTAPQVLPFLCAFLLPSSSPQAPSPSHRSTVPAAVHNRYSELWARVNREFADEWRSGMHRPAAGEGKDEGLVFFVRAGFRESSRWVMLFWEGDQMVSWQANDGIKSSVIGLLSGSLSGFPLNHSDADGYCTVDLPLLHWMELSAFTVVLRTHEGNKPGSNRQFYSNSRTLSHFARCAKIYKAWEFYRIQLVENEGAFAFFSDHVALRRLVPAAAPESSLLL